MFFYLFFFNSLLKAVAIDCVESGTVNDDPNSSGVFWSYRLGDNTIPDEASEAPFDSTSHYSAWNDIVGTKYLYYGAPLYMRVVDLNGDGSDEGVLLFVDNTEDETFYQVRFNPTNSPYHAVFLHFSLRGCNRLFVSDVTQEGSYDFIVGRIDGQTFKYQMLLDSVPFSDTSVDTAIETISLPFVIKDVFLLDGIGVDEGQHFLYVQGVSNYAIYIYSTGLAKFKLLSLASGMEIKKVQPIQSTQSSFISSYNVVVIYDNNQVDFLLMSSLREGLSSFKHTVIKTPESVSDGYVLDEVYVPSRFENRLAIWYQSVEGDAGYLVFFDAVENEDTITLIQTPESDIAPLFLEYKPKIVTYLPAHVTLNQSQEGSHMGRWVTFHHNYHYASPEDLYNGQDYSENP